MAEVLVQDTSLQAIADAIRAKTGGMETFTPAQMAAAIEAITGGDKYLELIYETDFTIEETNKTSTAVTVATISTGLNEQKGTEFYMVIECINDTDKDTSYNHIRVRTQSLIIMNGGYGNNQVNSGMLISDMYYQYGAKYGIWCSALGRYGASITIQTQYTSDSFGGAPSGEYRVRLYKLKVLEGV